MASVSVCVLGTWVSCAKTAEPIEMPFWELTHVGQRNNVLDGSRSPTGIGTFGGCMPVHGTVPTQVHCTLLATASEWPLENLLRTLVH